MYKVTCENCSKKVFLGKPKKLNCTKDGLENKKHIAKWAWECTAKNCKEYDCPNE